MPAYDATQFDPPAPVASVKLRHPDTGATLSGVNLLMDTGADVSLLPRGAIDQIGLIPIPGVQYDLMGFDGNLSAAPVVMADMTFLNRTFRGRYLLTDNSYGILGRDILNYFSLFFDGPQRQWDENQL